MGAISPIFGALGDMGAQLGGMFGLSPAHETFTPPPQRQQGADSPGGKPPLQLDLSGYQQPRQPAQPQQAQSPQWGGPIPQSFPFQSFSGMQNPYMPMGMPAYGYYGSPMGGFGMGYGPPPGYGTPPSPSLGQGYQPPAQRADTNQPAPNTPAHWRSPDGNPYGRMP